jgi:type IV pilus assembly protein PilW
MRNKSLGLTMVELLIGLTIGSLVVVGAVFVYSQSRTTYSINETQARLQENGRYALAIMEPDLQLAGYYGFSNEANDFYWNNGSSKTSVMNLQSNSTALSSPAAIGTCGTNFAVDLLHPVQGSNDAGGPIAVAACAPPSASPNAGAYVTGTDTLTIRRSSTETSTASASKIQLYLNATKRTNQSIFNSATAPGTVGGNREVRDLVVRTYYIAANSSMRTAYPTLWRKSLGTDGSAPKVLDEEILPGVEDLQVEFGIDDADHDGSAGIDAGQDKIAPIGYPDYFTGVVSRWVAPNDTLLDQSTNGRKAQIVAVRIWLRLRADQTEANYTDTRTYQYAGMSAAWNPATDGVAGFRRLLVSRTVYLRNVRFQ